MEAAAGVAVPEVAAEVADEEAAVDTLADLQDCGGAVTAVVERDLAPKAEEMGAGEAERGKSCSRGNGTRSSARMSPPGYTKPCM